MTLTEKKKWTIMVYLAGDNNLTANCVSVMQQLAAVEYKEDVCVLVCFDSNTPVPKGTRYLEINCPHHPRNNKFQWKMQNILVPPDERGHGIETPDFCPKEEKTDQSLKAEPVERTDVAEGFKRFLDWAVTHHSNSDRYMLILYGHGPVVAGKTFLARENPPSALSLEQLHKVLNSHFGPDHKRKLDILACQNCVMNGVETAFALKDHADFMIGSQSLVLADGWPYERILKEVMQNVNEDPKEIGRKILKACAIHLLDFSLMDRSSEQSICDLTRLNNNDNGNNIIARIRDLVDVLHSGLSYDKDDVNKRLLFPEVCNAVRLARLEAQSFWGEIFVDLSDFCERLSLRCDDVVVAHQSFLKNHGGSSTPTDEDFSKIPLISKLKDIIACCVNVIEEVQAIVPHSYYIGSELQYSHGLSIYFPWTLPDRPYFFERLTDAHDANRFRLRTSFETYSDYGFVKASNWCQFLTDFFRATLRNVQRAKRQLSVKDSSKAPDIGFINFDFPMPPQDIITIDLQKSSSDTGKVDYDVWSMIKNYPRRNYLSPADCPRKVPNADVAALGSERFPDPKSAPVSYLGWNIPELVAQAIREHDNHVNSATREVAGQDSTTAAPEKDA